jgi:hypothetical protein
MKITTNLTKANDLLQSYTGAISQVVMYSDSLKRMAIRITLTGTEQILYLVGVGCEIMNGRFRFSNAQLSITEELNKETDEIITIIRDKAGDFELKTSSGFSLAQGLESEFGRSFENFILNKE